MINLSNGESVASQVITSTAREVGFRILALASLLAVAGTTGSLFYIWFSSESHPRGPISRRW